MGFLYLFPSYILSMNVPDPDRIPRRKPPIPGIVVCLITLAVYLTTTGCVFGAGGDDVTRGCAITAEKSVDGDLLLTWQGGVELPDVQQYGVVVNDHTVLSRIHTPRTGDTETIPLNPSGSRVTVVVTYLDGRQETIYNSILEP